ncbi:MAG TPA: hypothetical protein VJ464_15415 [Blastocatellia bacterium]|nr:hypothetical protein [Blastocatellia bacterium]
MPKRVKEKLKNAGEKARRDQAFADEVQKKSIAAVLKGAHSKAWQTYLETILGADSPKQLARLKLEDGKKGDPLIIQSAVYAVANAVCTVATTTKFDGEVDDKIDADIPPEGEGVEP